MRELFNVKERGMAIGLTNKMNGKTIRERGGKEVKMLKGCKWRNQLFCLICVVSCGSSNINGKKIVSATNKILGSLTSWHPGFVQAWFMILILLRI